MPSGSSFTVKVHAVDFYGHVSPGTDVEGLVLVVDSSFSYWPNSHAGGGAISIVDGKGTMAVTMPVGFGFVTLSLEDSVGVGADTNAVATIQISESEDVFGSETLVLEEAEVDAAYVRVALATTQDAACEELSKSFLRDITEQIWTLCGKDLVDLADIRVGAFACTNAAAAESRSTAAIEYRVETTGGQEAALLLLDRVQDMLVPRAVGTSPLEDAAQADALLGVPEIHISGHAGVVGAGTEGGACTTTDWTPWSACSVSICGDSAGSQVRARTCVNEADTQFCPSAQCGDCSVDNGGCSPNADCTLDDALQAVCSCDQSVFIGTGNACLERTAAQQEVAGIEIEYAASLAAVAKTVQSQPHLISALESNMAAALSVSADRLVASAVRPVTDHSFVFSALVLPPRTADESVAAEIEGRIGSAHVFQGFRLSYQGADLVPSGTDRFGQMYNAPSNDATMHMDGLGGRERGSGNASASDAGGAVADAATGVGDTAAATAAGWTRKDTISLLAVLVVISVLLLIAFEGAYLQTRKANASLHASNAATGGTRSSASNPNQNLALVGGGSSSILFGLPPDDDDDGTGWTPPGFNSSGVDDFEPFPG